MQLLEGECTTADETTQGAGPCTLCFLEENSFELFYELLRLENSVSVQKTIIKVREAASRIVSRSGASDRACLGRL